jgi:hypothetical protein
MARRPVQRPTREGRRRMVEAVRESRVASVVRLVALGDSRAAILDHCGVCWGLSPRSADRLLAAARAKVAAELDAEVPELVAAAVAELGELETEARQMGDQRLRLDCSRRRERLIELATKHRQQSLPLPATSSAGLGSVGR